MGQSFNRGPAGGESGTLDSHARGVAQRLNDAACGRNEDVSSPTAKDAAREFCQNGTTWPRVAQYIPTSHPKDVNGINRKQLASRQTASWHKACYLKGNRKSVCQYRYSLPAARKLMSPARKGPQPTVGAERRPRKAATDFLCVSERRIPDVAKKMVYEDDARQACWPACRSWLELSAAPWGPAAAMPCWTRAGVRPRSPKTA